MKKSSIQIGNQYEVQAGRNKTKVKIVSFSEEKQSWQCETPNGKIISIKDTARFLKEVGEKKSLREVIESKGVTIIPRERRATNTMSNLDDPTFTRKHHVDESGVLVLEDETPKHLGPKPAGVMSVLAAAHRVLQEEGRPMKVSEIMEAALERNYCKVGGKTPFNTFNGGIRKEITKKGNDSRFVWAGKGLFAARSFAFFSGPRVRYFYL